MQNFMRYIATGCIAFTFSCLFYLLFSALGIFPSFSDQMVFNMFCISAAIILLICLSHLLPIENPLLARLFELFSVLIVLISASFFFNIIPLSLKHLVPTLIIGVFTYFIVITVIFIGDQASASRINKIIRKQREGESYDEDY